MDDRLSMRASDEDRQEVLDRLRAALAEGRLKMDEYLERMGQASEAVTYGDLKPLYADLPESAAVARHEPPAPSRAQPPPQASPRPGPVARRGFAGLPTPLRVLWGIWGAVVAVNLVVWVLVCVTTVSFVYPWPLWVAGPWGAVLLAISIAVKQARHDGRPR